MTKDTPQDDSDEDNITDDTGARWVGLGTVVTFIVFVAFVALIIGAAVGVLSLSAIGQAWFILFSTIVMMAAVWLYGEDTLKAVQEARGD